jgi:hypothetical protein
VPPGPGPRPPPPPAPTSSTSADAGVVGDTKATVTVCAPGEAKVNVEHGAAAGGSVAGTADEAAL